MPIMDEPANTKSDGLRAPDGRWKPGVSPNPSGRSLEVKAVRKAALELCPEAIATLASYMRSGDPKYAIPACVALLDRGLGKPKEHIELEHVIDDRRALDQMERLRANPKTSAALLTLAEAIASEPQPD